VDYIPSKYMQVEVETSEASRIVVIHDVPQENYLAYDASGLSVTESNFLSSKLKEYDAYVKQRMRTTWSFDDWLNQTSSTPVSNNVLSTIHRPLSFNSDGVVFKKR
jgi:hypothetical protein